MSSVDFAWLRMDSPHNLMMIVGVEVFEQPIKYKNLRDLLEQRLLKFSRFTQKVELEATGAFWVDDTNFDLDEHLVVHTLPGPSNESQMQDFVGSLTTQAFDPSKPLWQMHLVEGYLGSNALVTRIHHCIADGMALVGVLMSLMDGGEAPRAKKAAYDLEPNPWAPYLRPMTQGTIKAINTTGVAMTKSLEILAQPDRLIDYAQILSRVIKDAAKIAIMPNDSVTRFKGKPGPTKRVAWNKPLPLVEVKAVAKALGASVNDVLLSCVAGAMRRYLIEQGDSTGGVEIRAMVPVNLRPHSDVHKLGNRFGLVPMTLPVGEANPLRRVFEVRRRMDELKKGYQAMLAFTVLGLVGLTPKPVQAQVLDLLSRKATAVMTNVPGPSHPIKLAGCTVSRIMFWVPQSGDIGMGVSILSYNGGVQFGLITDAGMVPDPQAVIDFFEPEFDRLVCTLALIPRDVLLLDGLSQGDIEHQLFGV